MRSIEDRVDIRDKELSFDKIVDHLRYEEVPIYMASLKQPTLDDVFLHYTGKELRE